MNINNQKNEYFLNFREDFVLPYIDFVFKYSNYGKVDYVCIYNPKQKSFSAYLSPRGLKQAAFCGRKKILDNALWQSIFTKYQKYFGHVDRLETSEIPDINSQQFKSWWEQTLNYIKIIHDIYFYCEEPTLLYLEKHRQKKEIEQIFYYIGKYKLEAHKRLSILHIIFDKLIIKINQQYNIPLDDLRILTFPEFNGLIKSNFKKEYIQGLDNRKKGYVYYKNWSVYDGSQYEEWRKKLLPNDQLKQVKGVPAYQIQKKVIGKIKSHISFSYVSDLPKDCILVTGMTNPQLVPFLKNVKGIVTDEGGLMCHAAIISRELKIPCIVGTREATQIFKDGDLVELDTQKGIVKKIK